MNVALLIPIVTGLALGALVNYLSDVLPATRHFSKPVCPQCGHPYSLLDYLTLQPCKQCSQRRSVRTWLTFIALIGLSVYLWKVTPVRLGYPLAALIAAYLAMVFVIDVEQRLILHSTSVFGAFLALGAGWLSFGLSRALLGGLAGLAIMLALYFLGVLFARYRARKMAQDGQAPDDEEALGFGDVTLSAVLGLLLGWPRIWFGLLQGILLAGIFGALLVVFMLIVRKYKENVLMVFMPYGPFLIISAFLIRFVPGWIAFVVPK